MTGSEGTPNTQDGPDTRDLAAALILDHFPESSSKAVQVANALSNAGLLVPVAPTPPLPPEPPNLTVCPGTNNDIWRRDDLSEGDGRWWRLAAGDFYSYKGAVECGMDPSRRLVELPEPHGNDAMHLLADLVGAEIDVPHSTAFLAARVVVRALTERGQT